MLKLPVKPPIVNENIDLSEYAKKSDVDAIGTSLGNKAEKKEVEKINSQLDTLTKNVDDEIKEIQSTTDTFKENINTSFNEFSNEQQNNFEALREEVLSDIEASYVGYDNEQHHNLESRLYSDFDKINQRFNNNSYLEYEGISIKANNTYYGLTKEATVKGRTLQNLTINNGTDLYGTSGRGAGFNMTFIDGYMEYKTQPSPYTSYITIRPHCQTMLKNNTTYTIIFDIRENTIPNYKGVTVSGTNDCYYGLQIYRLYHNGEFTLDKGVKKIVVTTDDYVNEYTGFGFGFPSIDANVDTGLKFVIGNTMVLEGDHTNTPIEELPFVEGIQGTGDTTKNLFNVNLVQGTIGSGGQFVTDVSAVRTNESIKVEGGKTYTKSNSLGIKSGRIAFYNNSEFISAVTDTDTFTVPSDANEVMFSIYKGTTLSPNDILWVQLEEGTEATSYEPYYDGYKISGKSCGKNLFDLDLINKQAYLLLNGVDIIKHEGYIEIKSNTFNSYNYFLTNGIKLKPNTSYTISIDSYMTCRQTINLCNNNHQDSSNYGTILLDTNRSVCTKKFITDDNGMFYLSAYTDVLRDELNSIFIYSIQLEENTVATPYEPYQESTYSYLLDEPLMQLPNGVADSINLETGVLTRRVGKVVLDGSENWLVNTQISAEGCLAFYFKPKNGIVCNKFAPIISDKFKTLIYDVTKYNDWKEGCVYHGWQYGINIIIDTSKLTTQDIQGFKQWLQANPTTVYYELAEPTTEQLTPTRLKSFEGTTHIISNNTLQARTSVKIHSYVQAVVTNLINENKALRSNVDILNVENEGLKETNEVQDELIDINMMATDEVYTMIEPLLASQPMSMERGMSKLVDMYVAMVQRGLKTIDQVPIRYRAEVQAILEALEK